MSEQSRAVERLARLGYGCRGLVYVIVGWFAVKAAMGRSEVTDTRGALAELLGQPLGRTMLAVVALGLCGYALWRLVEGVLDLDGGSGGGVKEWGRRGGRIASGLIHLGLAAAAVGLILGTGGSGGGDQSARDWTAWLLSFPFGRVLVALVGVAVLAASAAQAGKAWKAGFANELPPDPEIRRVLCPVGRAGLAAKSLVFALVGLFFLLAAWRSDASESGGLAQALRTLQDQPFGPWLLGVVAVGLVAFGIYSVAMGLYRRIDAGRAEARLRAAL